MSEDIERFIDFDEAFWTCSLCGASGDSMTVSATPAYHLREACVALSSENAIVTLEAMLPD